MAQEYRKIANYENHNIFFMDKKMVEKIKTAHLEVENNMLKKYINECKIKIKLLFFKGTTQKSLEYY